MKPTLIIKILLDITMTVLYALLMFGANLGLFFHEVAGIGIGVMFIIHIALNKGMFMGLAKQIGFGGTAKQTHLSKTGKYENKKPPLSKVVLFASDIALVPGMIVAIGSGILISRELLTINLVLPWALITSIHIISSYVCLGILILHLLLHGKYLVTVFKKLPAHIHSPGFRSGVRRFAAGMGIAVVLYGSVYMAYYGKIYQPTESFGKEVSLTPMIDHPSEDKSLQKEDGNEEGTENKVVQPATATIQPQGETIKPQEETTQPATATIQPQEEAIPSLEAFLGNMHCTACSKYCLLTNLRCNKGIPELSAAKELYYNTYPQAN